MSSFSTTAIHGTVSGHDQHGALRQPVYDSVAFEHPDARSMEMTFAGKKAAHAYSRISNPTVSELEDRVSSLCHGAFVIAVSSGMASISNTILALGGAGSNIVTSPRLFGNSLSLFSKTLHPWGLETRCVDMTNPEEVERAVDSGTRMVFFESMTNPGLEVADARLLAGICQAKRVPLVCDNTVMTPYLFEAGKAGINIELVSSTKYISGGATSVGGLIIDHRNFDWSHAPALADTADQYGEAALLHRLRHEVFRNLGACLAPHNAWLQTLGLETLDLRIEKSSANALAVARFLASEKQIGSVNYPGLADNPYHPIAKEQFKNRFGGILTFDLGDEKRCFRFIDSLKLIRRATNINDNKSLIIHPASTIFNEYNEDELTQMGVGAGMVRLATGIEEPNDIINDLKRGIKSL